LKSNREIKIKNPGLQILRNSLREILWLEWNRRLNNVIQAQNHLHDADISQEEKLLLHKSLQLDYAKTKKIIKTSIIMCGWCHQKNRDTIYNSTNNQWFCPKCYNEHREELSNTTSLVY